MNRDLSIFYGVVGLLIGGLLVALATRLIIAFSAAAIACGFIALILSRSLADAQRELAARPWAPRTWANAQPFKVRLWGVGALIIGVLSMISSFK